MKKLKNYTSIIFACILTLGISIISSCSSDSKEEIEEIETSICDTSNLDYQTTIEPILNKNCYSCHDATSSNIKLASYPQVKVHVENGKLLGSVKHMPGHIPMPPNTTLSSCDIDFIDAWIQNGAPEKK
jgi:cytochrome c551/c552